MSQFVNILVEGRLDDEVLRHILSKLQISVGQTYGSKGKAYIEAKVQAFSRSAIPEYPYICLIDLDNQECVVEYINNILPSGSTESFILRIAVKELESWLIADRENLSKFLNAPLNQIPILPDECPDPKGEIISLARQYADRQIREDIIPEEGSSNAIGKGYVTQLIRYTMNYWNIDTAIQNSPSLARAVQAFQSLNKL